MADVSHCSASSLFLSRSYTAAAALSSSTSSSPSALIHSLSLLGARRFPEAVLASRRIGDPSLRCAVQRAAVLASRTEFARPLWDALGALRGRVDGVEGVEGVLRGVALARLVAAYSVVGVQTLADGLGVGAEEVRRMCGEAGWAVRGGFVEVGHAGEVARGGEDAERGMRETAERLVRMQTS